MDRHQATEQLSFEEAIRDDIRRAREGPILGHVNSDHYRSDRYCAYVRRGIYHRPISHVEHLDATSGQWHTTEPDEEWENPTLDSPSSSGSGLIERLKMVVRLGEGVLYLSVRQLADERAHGLSWPATNVVKQYAEETDVFKPTPFENKKE